MLQIFFQQSRRVLSVWWQQWLSSTSSSSSCQQFSPSHACPEGRGRQLRASMQMGGEGSGRSGHLGAGRRKGKANNSASQHCCWKAVQQFTPLASQSKLPKPHGTVSISCLVDVIFTSYSCFFLKWILHCKTNFVPLLNECWLLINTLLSSTSSICKQTELNGVWAQMKRNSI